MKVFLKSLKRDAKVSSQGFIFLSCSAEDLLPQEVNDADEGNDSNWCNL